MEAPLIGAAEAAHIAGCSVRTITRAAAAGHLPATKLGDATAAYVFTRSAVEAWAAARDAEAVAS